MIRKICFCIPNLEYGGSTEVVINLANEFLARGYDVFVVTAYDFVADKYFGFANKENIHFYSCHKRNCFDLTFIKKLKKILLSIKPDVISSHLSMTTYVSLIDKTTPICHTIHSNPKKDFNVAIRFLLKHAPNVSFIACSNSVFELAKGIYKERLYVAQNGLYALNSSNSKFHSTKKDIDFLFIGRFDKVKCIPDLIKAFAIVHNKNTRVKLCLCGSGREKNKICRIITKQKIDSDCVLMPGFVDNVSDYYLRSKVFCLFSSREGGPMCLLEANSYGLPIICTKIPGNANYAYNGKNALMFDVHNFEEASVLMEKIINNEELYNKMVKNSLAAADANLFETTANKYLEIMNYVKR